MEFNEQFFKKMFYRKTMLDQNFVISNFEESISFAAAPTSLAIFISTVSTYIRK